MRKLLVDLSLIIFQILICGLIGALIAAGMLYLMNNNNSLISAIGYIVFIFVILILATIMYAEKQLKDSRIFAISEG